MDITVQTGYHPSNSFFKYNIQALSTKAIEMDCIVLSWDISAIIVLHPDTSLIPKF